LPWNVQQIQRLHGEWWQVDQVYHQAYDTEERKFIGKQTKTQYTSWLNNFRFSQRNTIHTKIPLNWIVLVNWSRVE
jgi:hypothetical protein